MHVAENDNSRLAHDDVLPTDQHGDALAFLERALCRSAAEGVTVGALMTDNGSRHISHAWRDPSVARGLRHRSSWPHPPRTTSKAERFIQILLRSWAYACPYRSRALNDWLRCCRPRRPHGSLGGLRAVSRFSHLCGQYTLQHQLGAP